MAINAICDRDSSCKQSGDPSSGRNSESPSNSNELTMNSLVKKERRKPPLEIYRPGMGLNGKNSKMSDVNLNTKVTTVTTHSSENCNSTNNAMDEKRCDQNKPCKNTRSRRPDIQVYMPKGKVAALLCEKQQGNPKQSSFGEKKEGTEKERKKKPNLSNYSDNTKNNLVKESEKGLHNISKCSNSSSPQPSWADVMEESDLSNARSTPEDELCNGHVDYSRSALGSRKMNHEASSKVHKKMEDHPKKQRSRRNSLRNDSLHINHTESGDWSSKKSEYPQIRIKEIDDSDNHPKFDKAKRFNRGRHTSGNTATEKTFQKSLDSSSGMQDKSAQNCNVTGTSKMENYSSDYNLDHSITLDNKSKSDKKKREKVDQAIPPRFQRNKSQNMDTFQNMLPVKSSSLGQNGSGGILKLPVECEAPEVQHEIIDSNYYAPSVYPEPQNFIHKQLFDPNNPSKPEIVNIPAPVPHPISYSPYYSADSSYIAAPVPNAEYIPPPQPVAINQQYRFIQPNVAVNHISSPYLNSREIVAPPIPCPVPTSPLNTTYNRSLPMYSEISTVLPELGKRRLKPIVEKNLHEIVLLEKELLSSIAKGYCDTNIKALKQCRWKLQLRFENIILADPKYCAEKNPEQNLWKLVFHQIIEFLRKKLEDKPGDSEDTKENLQNIILEGSMFYENLLEKQQETYGFKLTKVLELEHISSACLPEQLRCVLISVQKSLIYLGDLARYKEQISQTSNYGKARSWYLKAQQIAPKNGRPYHQLALLALNTRRKLDAVYYFMRSLAASNPFLSAKEMLLNLFDEAKKKFETYEKKRAQGNVAALESVEDSSINERCEIWIKNDGSSAQGPTDKKDASCDLKKMSDVELNKRFVISFLHVHGKLFTKVGMETFPEVLKVMVNEFSILLQRSPLPITSARILQLVAINIFSVTNSSLKENGRERGECSLLQEQALYASMTMISLLMDRCRSLHISHKSSPAFPDKIISDDLAQLLPAVKIWTDWMSCQKCLWAPPSSAVLKRLKVDSNNDVWRSFADLLTALREIDTSSITIVNMRTSDSELIILEEDSTFAGFVPLLEALHNPAFALNPFDKDRAKHSLRINRIQFFGDYLCGISPPFMEFDIGTKKFVSLVNKTTLEESFDRSVSLGSTDELFIEENLEDSLVEKCTSKSSERDELQALWHRKETLSKAKEQQEKHQAQVQAVLFKHQNQRPIVLKVKPRYLIPDTNCFIDHLCHFKSILASSGFHLVVPLVVINELDGLARGTKINDHSTPEHTNKVTALSREAIHFLEQEFASRHPHLRAITSKGSVLDTISFRSEEMGNNKATNDDLILTCSLNYCKDRPELFMPKIQNEPITLFREVVLLTDDRNLRVKALAHHVPVRDVLSFLQWANS